MAIKMYSRKTGLPLSQPKKKTNRSNIKSRSNGRDQNIVSAVTNSNNPIKLNEPLCIEIVTLYTGNAPTNFWGSKKELLLNSGIKKLSQTNAAPKAIHALLHKPKDYFYIEPSAFDFGSNLIFYTPALESFFNLSFILMPEKIDPKEVDQLGKLFQNAQSIPIFAPANAALMIGNILSKSLSAVLRALSSTSPFLDDTLKIDSNLTTDYVLISSPKSHPQSNDEFNGHEIVTSFNKLKKETRVFLAKENKEYKGDSPYIILSIKNQARPDLEDFEPAITSAEILNQFYKSDSNNLMSEAFTTVLSSINDINYVKKIAKLKKVMAHEQDATKKQELQGIIEDLKGKIRDTDILG